MLFHRSKKKDIPMNRKLLMQVDNAIDQELVLETLDLSRCNLGPDDLRLIIDAIGKALEYEYSIFLFLFFFWLLIFPFFSDVKKVNF